MCCGAGPVPTLPSPKSHSKVIGSPSGSLEPVLENWTVSGASPEVGVPDATATGGVFPAVYRIRRTSLALIAT